MSQTPCSLKHTLFIYTFDGPYSCRFPWLRNGSLKNENVLSSGVKNILAFAFVIPTFWFFGWWVYWAFPTGLSLSMGPMEISGAEYASAIAWGWGESAQYMGPNIADNASGVFWGACTVCCYHCISDLSRYRANPNGGFCNSGDSFRSFAWVAAAWGWHADGCWLKFGVHDFGAAGLVHASGFLRT